MIVALSWATWLAVCGGLGAGCDDDGVDRVDNPATGVRNGGRDAGGSTGGDEDAGADACAGAPDGTECSLGRHCIDERCVYNTCGDGVVAETEECDDGNVALGDACDPQCRKVSPRCGDGKLQDGEECDDGNWFDADGCTTKCTVIECGNGRLEAAEECDDGNRVNDDECSDACTENQCLNGRLDPGEECDDGNRVHDDGCNNACEIVGCPNGEVEAYEECDDGNEVDADACSNECTKNECGNTRIDVGELCDGDVVGSDGKLVNCSDDCKSTEDDTCRPCEEEHCRAYTEDLLDPLRGCYEMVIEDFGAAPDATFLQECIDIVSCARQNRCWTSPDISFGAAACYCGSRSASDCAVMGPADDAPCVEEWLAGTRATSNADAVARFSAMQYPSGWAFTLLQCDLMHCAQACGAEL